MISLLRNIKQKLPKGISVLNFSNTRNVAEYVVTLLSMTLSEREIVTDPQQLLM